MTAPTDAFIWEKQVRDLMREILDEDAAPTTAPAKTETLRATVSPTRAVNGFVEFGSSKTERARNAFGVMARCSVHVYGEGTLAYPYLTEPPSAEFLEKRGNGYESRQRFALLESVVNRETGELAVRVWMLPSHIARMQDAIIAKRAAQQLTLPDDWGNE